MQVASPSLLSIDELCLLGLSASPVEHQLNGLPHMGHADKTRMQNVFAYPQVGEVDAPKTDVGWVSESLGRLLDKKGGSMGKVADEILKRAGGPDLKADKRLYSQFKATILRRRRKLLKI